MKKALIVLLTIVTASIHAQVLKPQGAFHSDSTKIGYPVKYTLSITHQSDQQFLFPDSSYNFAPFELISKEYFPTKTINGLSHDSAVYVLRTFTINPTLAYALPVFTIEDGDSSSVYTQADTIQLKEYLPESPVNETFKEQATFNKIEEKFNYPYYLSYLAGAFIAGCILYFSFGKTIRRRYKLIIIRSDHVGFLRNFQRLQNDFVKSKKSSTIEQALSIWKDYHAKLDHKPVHTFTTTEIINLYNQEDLQNGLNIIDKAIYGGQVTEEAEKAIGTLRKFSVRQYHKAKREIQNG